MLEEQIRRRLRQKPLLIMAHIVIGYPSFRESWALARGMVDAGVDLLELQIPFSEPMADGPVILAANQKALEAGATVAKCFDFARELASQVQIPLLFVSYYNILFKYGLERFAADAKQAGVSGVVVTSWYALLAPRGTPPALTASLARDAAEILKRLMEKREKE